MNLFKRKEVVTISVDIELGKKVMEAINVLQVLLRKESSLKDWGEEIVELEIFLNPHKTDEIKLVFFTPKDFSNMEEIRNRALPGTMDSQLRRPKDSEKKVAIVSLSHHWRLIDLYIYDTCISRWTVSTKEDSCNREISRRT